MLEAILKGMNVVTLKPKCQNDTFLKKKKSCKRIGCYLVEDNIIVIYMNVDNDRSHYFI